MTTFYVYVSKGLHDHLIDEDETTIHLADAVNDIPWGDLGKTLCGQSLEGLSFGDETVSGVAATCRKCRLIAHNTNWPADQKWTAADVPGKDA